MREDPTPPHTMAKLMALPTIKTYHAVHDGSITTTVSNRITNSNTLGALSTIIAWLGIFTALLFLVVTLVTPIFPILGAVQNEEKADDSRLFVEHAIHFYIIPYVGRGCIDPLFSWLYGFIATRVCYGALVTGKVRFSWIIYSCTCLAPLTRATGHSLTSKSSSSIRVLSTWTSNQKETHRNTEHDAMRPHQRFAKYKMELGRLGKTIIRGQMVQQAACQCHGFISAPVLAFTRALGLRLHFLPILLRTHFNRPRVRVHSLSS